MSGSHHAVVWIDHAEAKVFRFSGDEDTEVDLHSHVSVQRLHHRPAGSEVESSGPQDTEFYKRIVGALDQVGRIVITGPGNAKDALNAFLTHYRPNVAARVLAVETTADPGAHVVLALARRFFKGAQPLES